MNFEEAINIRKSRRSYLMDDIEHSKIAVLEDSIKEINEESGLSTYFLEDGEFAFKGITKSYGMFKNVKSLILLKGPKDDPNLKEKIGYYGELLVLEATKLGLGTCWVGGTFDKSSLVDFVKNDELVSVITIGNVSNEEGFKEKFIYKIAHRKTKPIEEMYVSDTTPPDWFINAMKAVQKAPSAINSQKSKFELKNNEVRASIPNNYVFDMVDLGIAKLHFELIAGGKFELGNNGIYKRSN